MEAMKLNFRAGPSPFVRSNAEMHGGCKGNLDGRTTDAQACSSSIGDGFWVKLV